jgi:glutamyl-tRNA(Gln) amidotransferase subunit E
MPMNPPVGIREPWLLEPLPEYGTLADAAYAELGLKVGLEIHQQLATHRKLFCRCPAGRYSERHHAEVLRHMRPTLSEMGEYDGTALMEFKTRKEIIYLLNNDTVCTYEMDDAPPFEIDDEALDISLAIAMLLGCNVVSEVHISRKQYLDGSIPTGFQRTAIVGTDGDVPFRDRSIHIRQISIEEDSCREVSDRGHVRTYRTDRLGMPLIETVTDPDMRTPEEAMAVGQRLRWLCRISERVRTGAGAARQDVNVSVAGGTRIEIKGVPSLRAIPRLVHSEALRQRTLLAIRDELRHRGVAASALVERQTDVTTAVRATSCDYLRRALDAGATVLAVPLPGFDGLLEAATQPRTRFLKEFSDRVRVIACLDELPNLLASNLDTGALSSAEWAKIVKACGVGVETPVIVVWGAERDAATAAREIVIRAREALAEVPIPNETRQALDDGTTGFERILPGADRMYPDTDLPPLPLTDDRIDAIRTALPERPWEREAELRRAGVGADLAERLGRSPAYGLFQRLHDRLEADGGYAALSPTRLASLLLDRRCGRPAVAAESPWWERAVARIARGELLPEGLAIGVDPPPRTWDEARARARFDALLASLSADGPEAGPRRRRWAMGELMRELRGRVPGRRVAAWLEEARL